MPISGPGDNKWTCTFFARRPETGEAIWAYQINPHDDHDYDGVNENILLDLNINGQPAQSPGASRPQRATCIVIDRATGEVISAEAFAYQNTTRRRRSEDRQAQDGPAKDTGFENRARYLPCAAGRQRLAAFRVLAAHRLDLHAA